MIALGVIGTFEIILIVAGLLLLFGPSRLPALARSIGQSIREFKNGSKGQIDNDGKVDRDESDEKKS